MASVGDDSEYEYSRPPLVAFDRPNHAFRAHYERQLFFHAIYHVHTRVVDNLLGEPLDLFRSVRPLLTEKLEAIAEDRQRRGLRVWRDASDPRAGHPPLWDVIKHADERDPEALHRLRAALLDWADRWRLWPADPEDDWCLDIAAFEVLGHMADAELGAYPFFPIATAFGNTPFSEEEIRFTFSSDDEPPWPRPGDFGWCPSAEPWSHAEARLDVAYQRAKEAYRKRLENLAEERGLLRFSESRRRKGEPLEWLALYQTRQERWTWIADWQTARLKVADGQACVSRQGVERGAKAKAELIGLRLAEPQRGRPPSSTPRGKTATYGTTPLN